MVTLSPTLDLERAMFRAGCLRLAALDEVGRGALAGPVSVGAVVIDASIRTPPRGLKDSKLLTPAARERLMAPIGRWVVSWAIGHASPSEIDQVGIMGALTLAAHRALDGLDGPVDAVLLDGLVDYVSAGNRVMPAAPVTTRAKADRDCASVAAASVLAKVTRDAMMTALDRDYPQYHWAQNKGYGTGPHAAALAAYGPCERHRRSWRLPECVPEALAVDV